MTVRGTRRPPTWSLLGDVKRKVTEYEAVTAKFHYHFRRDPVPFELDPDQDLNVWYLKYREGSPFQVADWEDFRDPHKLTYRAYVALQKQRETYMEGLVDDFERHDHDAGLDPEWVSVLEHLYVPARFTFHTMQMTALCVGQMAPSSYITNCSHFQAADEMRRIQWYAYRARSLSLTHGQSLADTDATRNRWETDEAWQAIREAVEKMLIAYDWGEAFAVLDLVIKPAVDELFNKQLGDLARANGDDLTARMGSEFELDSNRSKDWVSALTQYAIRADAGHAALLSGWVAKWSPLVDRSIAGLASVSTSAPIDPDAVTTAVGAARARFLETCGLA